MGQFVIAAYRPRAGEEARLLDLVREHVPILRAEGLATDRPAYAMQAADGTIVEVFEWESAEAIERAHTNPTVLALWARFGAACEIVPLASLAECHAMFAGFTPVAV
jgi:quinol monooxygenase YgiN